MAQTHNLVDNVPKYEMINGQIYKLFKDLFGYSWEVLPNTANTTSSPVNVTVIADSDFEAVKGIGSLFGNTAAHTSIDYQDITITVFDSGAGRNLFDKPVEIRHVFGHPQEPILYEPPRIFVGNSTITITFINNSNVDTNVRCTMLGYKLYRIPAAQDEIMAAIVQLAAQRNMRVVPSNAQVRA